MLQHTDRLVAKIPAMDVDLRKDTLKETRRAALLEWLSRLGLKQCSAAAAAARLDSTRYPYKKPRT